MLYLKNSKTNSPLDHNKPCIYEENGDFFIYLDRKYLLPLDCIPSEVLGKFKQKIEAINEIIKKHNLGI